MTDVESSRTAFGRAVGVVQYLTGVAAATAVVLLFTLGGDADPISPDTASDAGDPIVSGRSVYAAECAICHGPNGEGGTGPTLIDGLVEKYPNPAVQEAIVTNGRNAMQGFGTRLTPAEIVAVVRYTRTELAADPPP